MIKSIKRQSNLLLNSHRRSLLFSIFFFFRAEESGEVKMSVTKKFVRILNWPGRPTYCPPHPVPPAPGRSSHGRFLGGRTHFTDRERSTCKTSGRPFCN